MKSYRTLLVVIASLTVMLARANAHCEIPCGIFDDSAVFSELMLDATTIEKSMNQINTLSADPAANANQLTRWVMNKEAHAEKVQKTMARYFLAQRVKTDLKESDPERYGTLLEKIHEITVLAMRCKHGTDTALVERLREAIHDFQHAYAQ